MNPDVQKRVTDFLGLCMRAGKIISGQESCVDLMRREAAAIVFIDSQASENTRKRLMDAAHSHDIALYELEAGELGHSIGKPNRMTAALEKGGMADKLLSLTQSEPRL